VGLPCWLSARCTSGTVHKTILIAPVSTRPFRSRSQNQLMTLSEHYILSSTTARLSSDDHQPLSRLSAITQLSTAPSASTTSSTVSLLQQQTLLSAMASWSNDYCLSCDRQMSEPSAYCSQACRLADLEKAGRVQTSSQLSSSASSTSSSTNGFYLPPAVNFSAYKAPSGSKGFDMAPASPYHYYPTANGSYFAPPTATKQSPQRSLTPSSSRSSLASASSQTHSGVSQQAASQLNNYMRQFDQTRDMKRRYTQY
jgi:hypothetical protein